MLLRAVYISECRDGNWIIIQIVGIHKWVESRRRRARGVSLCVRLTHVYDDDDDVWLMLCFVVLPIYITPFYLFISLCSLWNVSNSHARLLSFRITLQTFRLHRLSHPKRLKLQCNMSREGTHKSIVYMATPIDQSSTATLPHIHTNVNPYVAHISFYLLQTAFFCFAFAVLFVLVIFMSVWEVQCLGSSMQ